jgi:outer membrane protein assembly factor BamB
MKKTNIILIVSIIQIIFLSIGAAEQINNLSLKDNLAKEIIHTRKDIDHPWPMFRHDLKHTGYTEYTGPASPTLSWKYTVNNGIVSSAAISNNNTIYVGTGWNLSSLQKGSLYAFHTDGTLKWKYADNKGFFSSPSLGPDGIIYITGLDGALYAFRDEGTFTSVEWKKPLKFFFNLCSPAVDENGIIHVGSPSYDYYQIYPNSITKYRYQTDWCIISSPAIDTNGTVYIGSKDHNVYAFSNNPPALKWKFSTGIFYDGHLVDSSPAIGKDGTIYVGTDPYGAFDIDPIEVYTNFWAINPDGTLKWVFETQDGVESSPAIGPDNTIYFGSYDGYLYAIQDNHTHPTLKWTYKTNGSIDGSPIVDGDGTIYFGSRDGTLYALFSDGTLKWKFHTDSGFESSPSIDHQGHLYIGSFDETFYCLGSGGPDIGISSIDISSHLVSYKTLIPKVSIRNYRSIPQHCNITCTIVQNETMLYNQDKDLNITGGETIQVSFPTWFIDLELGKQCEIIFNITKPVDENNYNNKKSLNLFTSENNPPNQPQITGPTKGNTQIEYSYKIYTLDPDNDLIWYLIDWGDDIQTDWLGPFHSGELIEHIHIWEKQGTYEIKIKSKDIYDAESNWSYLKVSIPVYSSNFFISLFKNFLFI